MARKSRKEKVRYRRMKTERHRTERTAPHSILGTLIGGSAAILPFVMPNPDTGGVSPVEFLGYAMDSASTGDNTNAVSNLRAAGQSMVSGVVTNFVPILGLAVLGAGVSWAGRRYAKSGTNISKKWRVF